MILFLSNADTELLALGSIVHRLPAGFPPVRAGSPGEAGPDLDGITAVVVRLLGGRSAWERQFDAMRKACLAQRIPLVAVGGEAAPDAELTRLSTVPAGIVTGETTLRSGSSSRRSPLGRVPETRPSSTQVWVSVSTASTRTY